MRHEHKEFFVVGGEELKSNKVYGDFKLLYREFKLDDPNPPKGVKLEWKKGTALVLYVEKDSDGKFPEVIVDSMTVQRVPEYFKREVKDPDGRFRRVKCADAQLFYGCKKVTAEEFGKLAGIIKESDKAEKSEKKK